MTGSAELCYIITDMENINIYFEKESYGMAVIRALREEDGGLGVGLAESSEGADIVFSGYPPLSEIVAAVDCLISERKRTPEETGAGSSSELISGGSAASAQAGEGRSADVGRSPRIAEPRRAPSAASGDISACELIAFTSCCGGCGLTTVSRIYADQLARLEGRRVLWLSFGVYAPQGGELFCYLLMKGAGGAASGEGPAGASQARSGQDQEDPERAARRCLARDEYGAFVPKGDIGMNGLRTADREECVSIMSAVCGSGLFDSVVLDLPFGFPGCSALLGCCERVVLVDDPLRTDGALEAFARDLAAVRAAGVPEEIFAPPRDDGDLSDIHGQLGSAVRRLIHAQAG